VQVGPRTWRSWRAHCSHASAGPRTDHAPEQGRDASPRQRLAKAAARGEKEAFMDLTALNKICFMICIVCIVIGLVLALAIIWAADSNQILWKGFASVSVVFAAAALTLAVSKTFEGRLGPSSGKQPEA
jgi:hypothetical protein